MGSLNPNHAWIQTVEGKAFFFLDPKPADFSISMIAHCLARECRWGNHIPEFYSVAEHSVRVSYVCDPEDALWGLLHDASEAFLTDVPTPIKNYLRYGIDEFIRRLLPLLEYSNVDFKVLEGELRAQCPDMLGYDELERRIQRAICANYNLPEEMPASVKHADAVLLVTEKRDLCLPPPLQWGPNVEPLETRIVPWSETDAKARFIRRFYELTR